MTADWCPTACRCESACDTAERLGEALRDGEYEGVNEWRVGQERYERAMDRRFGDA